MAKQLDQEAHDMTIASYYVIKEAILIHEDGKSYWYYTGNLRYPENAPCKRLDFEKQEIYVHKDFSEGNIYFQQLAFSNMCRVSSTELPEEWIITGKTKIVNGMLAQQTLWKGTKDVYAWFIPSIKIPDGPEEVAGFPGLVIEGHNSARTLIMTKLQIVTDPAKKNENSAA